MKGKAFKGLTSFGLDQVRVLRPGQAFQLIWEKFLTSEPQWLTGGRTEN